MNISEVTAFLYALKPPVIHFGLENTRQVLAKLGNPQATFRVVHVAGSNGKGSTCAFLDAILRQAGFRVGLFTSPHLIDYRERFAINGKPVDDADIVAAMEKVLRVGLEIDPSEVSQFIAHEDLLERMQPRTWFGQRGEASRFTLLTFFECTTVLAMVLFAEANVDVAVMETGMGGRLDATNVVAPMVSVITPIHVEHTAWLGDTLTKIAKEKAGIIKPGIPAVVASQHPEARVVFEQTAVELQAPLSLMGVDFDGAGGWRAASFRVGDSHFGPVRLGLRGDHQVINAAVALGCLPWLARELGTITESSLEKGLREVIWPGRFECFEKSPESSTPLVESARQVLQPSRTPPRIPRRCSLRSAQPSRTPAGGPLLDVTQRASMTPSTESSYWMDFGRRTQSRRGESARKHGPRCVSFDAAPTVVWSAFGQAGRVDVDGIAAARRSNRACPSAR